MKKDLSIMESDILVALSDFQPHNQNQITDLIGNNHKKTTDRVNVSRCLKDSKNLKLYLVPLPNKFGESGNRWVLRQNIQTLREIVKEYPSIIPDWQKNDKILDMIQDDHPELRYIDIEIPPEMRERFKYNPTGLRAYADKVITKRDIGKLLFIPFIDAQNQAAMADFKKYLRESHNFFKMCLLYDSKKLRDNAEGIHYGFLAAIVQDKEKVKTQCDSASGYDLSRSLYWFCCILDVLEL